MNKSGIFSKSYDIHTANWQDLYLMTEQWKDDMDFFKDELHFLHDLIGKYFIWMTKGEVLSKVQQMDNHMAEITKQREILSAKIDKHLGNLGMMIEDAFRRDHQIFRDEHATLEDSVNAYFKAFREVKKEVFAIAKDVMKSEKMQKMMSLPSH
ncbi:hypothetical protein [Reichenbachiella sp. MALMAid0571]|uniref:hypothetical protein n=1 Tax=Reichenbachiella sp. MALMAid0571 TaxID=3143939 RepID=UPI0032DFE436